MQQAVAIARVLPAVSTGVDPPPSITRTKFAIYLTLVSTTHDIWFACVSWHSVSQYLCVLERQ